MQKLQGKIVKIFNLVIKYYAIIINRLLTLEGKPDLLPDPFQVMEFSTFKNGLAAC